MRLLAPAKLNLHLRVGRSQKTGGFHPLLTWMCTVGLFDTLTFRQTDASSSASGGAIALECDDPTLPCDQTNLVLRAVYAVQAQTAEEARPGPGLHIQLQKRIPRGSGLGGGSSDAARTLLALNRLWQLEMPQAQLHELAAGLGSDVPFFLSGGSAICSGRGEIVTSVAPPRSRWALLVLPGLALATADVYEMFDRQRLGDVGFDAQPPWQEWADLSAGPLLSRLRNDLEPAAFALAPALGRLRHALETSLGRVIRMTGSGSALFTLFDQRHEAEVAAQFVRTRHMLEALAVELVPGICDDLSSASERSSHAIKSAPAD